MSTLYKFRLNLNENRKAMFLKYLDCNKIVLNKTLEWREEQHKGHKNESPDIKRMERNLSLSKQTNNISCSEFFQAHYMF